eukprot:CAMPEP_0181183554 /NCGR_PEP_ID=MMETSP1096-20121128/8488_1 /TAXON_ID=156174 ORGANISM="Chrysochromulina ericina, Strain CCMP281" /NCGR_SAMPLE_ID=MMETSP1096 /ASSEMBLY_ACC=CAM_ASM_000453 /LENGTH=78 /DNA_ID=CAMNT_0023272243 /DNA_START=571 /DNA_END=807 /DNA_ORIENTATION=-
MGVARSAIQIGMRGEAVEIGLVMAQIDHRVATCAVRHRVELPDLLADAHFEGPVPSHFLQAAPVREGERRLMTYRVGQ